MALLPQGGLAVGGRKIPWEAIAAVAGVAGVVLVLRARHQGQNVVSAGQAPAASPYTAASSGFGSTGFGPDYSGALANLSQQLTSLSQQQAVSGAPAAAAPTGTQASDRQANRIGVLSFGQWLSGAFTGTRPDLAQGIAQNRWGDISGQYAKEVAASEAQQLAAGGHF